LAQQYVNSLISIELLPHDGRAHVLVREFFNRIGQEPKLKAVHDRISFWSLADTAMRRFIP
jgi:hypothetical protein